MLSYLLPKLITHIFIVVVLVAIVLVGITSCNNSKPHENMQKIASQHGDIYFDDQEVYVTDEHLLSIKPKLYQPGLTLFGQLKPLKETIIVSPQRANIEQIFVHTGKQVAKGETLFSYTPAPIELEMPTLIDNIAPTNEELKQLEKTEKQTEEIKTTKTDTETDTKTVKDLTITNNTEANAHSNNKANTNNNETSNEAGNKYSNENSNETNTKNSTNTKNNTILEKEEVEITKQETKVMQAPFAGTISEMYYPKSPYQSNHFNMDSRMTVVSKDTPLMKLEAINDLYFVSVFPNFTKSKLSIGQHVNFVAQQMNGRANKNDDGNNINKHKKVDTNTNTSNFPNSNSSDNEANNKASNDNEPLNTDDVKLTGQISDIQPINDYEIQVKVHVLPDKTHKRPIPLMPGLLVQGRVDYGQMEVGTLVDETGVFETPRSDFNIFKLPDAHVSAPMEAYVWIVGHDEKIHKLPVYVISYDVDTKQYLVSDVPNEVMIILADLPKQAEGKFLKIQ